MLLIKHQCNVHSIKFRSQLFYTHVNTLYLVIVSYYYVQFRNLHITQQLFDQVNMYNQYCFLGIYFSYYFWFLRYFDAFAAHFGGDSPSYGFNLLWWTIFEYPSLSICQFKVNIIRFIMNGPSYRFSNLGQTPNLPILAKKPN